MYIAGIATGFMIDLGIDTGSWWGFGLMVTWAAVVFVLDANDRAKGHLP